MSRFLRALADNEYPTEATSRWRGWPVETTDSPDVVIAKRLLDYAKQDGFTFQRAAPGEDGALVGYRVSDNCVDLIHIEGFSSGCFAWRKRVSSLIGSQDALEQRQIEGSVLDVPKGLLVHTSRHGYQYAAPCRRLSGSGWGCLMALWGIGWCGRSGKRS